MPPQKRKGVLKEMGYKRYKDYLATALWRQIRTRIMKRADGRCERCKTAFAVLVHHLNYRWNTMHGLDDDSLLAVCNDCHKKWHGELKKPRRD